jgi:hypothetical protein
MFFSFLLVKSAKLYAAWLSRASLVKRLTHLRGLENGVDQFSSAF